MSCHIIFRSGWAFPDPALDPLRRLIGGMLPTIIARRAGRSGPADVPVIGSWSHGSFQSLEIAARNPGAIRALILISSTPRFCATDDFVDGLPEANLRAMQRSLSRDPHSTLRRFHQLCAEPAGLPEDELKKRVEHSLSLGIQTLEEGLRDLREKDFRDVIPRIDTPVLLLHGEEDRVIPAGASTWLAANMPRARLVTMPGAGHDLPLRNAEWCAGRIAEFLEQLP